MTEVQSPCNICYDEKPNFVDCLQCPNKVCTDCFQRLRQPHCPYCRNPYERSMFSLPLFGALPNLSVTFVGPRPRIPNLVSETTVDDDDDDDDDDDIEDVGLHDQFLVMLSAQNNIIDRMFHTHLYDLERVQQRQSFAYNGATLENLYSGSNLYDLEHMRHSHINEIGAIEARQDLEVYNTELYFEQEQICFMNYVMNEYMHHSVTEEELSLILQDFRDAN